MHNFDIISVTIHLDFKVTEKYKSAIITCKTLRNDDISSTSSKCRFREKKGKRQFISPLLWPPNSPDLNPVDYSVWSILQKVYKTRITDLDDLKHHIRTELAKLDHAVIAAAVRQWRRRLSALCQGGRWSFRALLLILTVYFCDNCGL